MTDSTPSEEAIDLEMAFSHQPHMDDRCREPYEIGASEFDDTYCCRKRGHEGLCAAGYRSSRIHWKGKNYA